eukprot:3749-Heterococcus_DN1.PRE.3
MALMPGTLRYRIAFVATEITGLAYLSCRCWVVWGSVGGAEKWSVANAHEDSVPPSLCELESFDEADYPKVVVYIPTYDAYRNMLEQSRVHCCCCCLLVILATEPASVLFPVITAALKIDYPQHKLKVLVLDDGARDFVQDYVLELQTMLLEAGSGRTLDYIARIKPAQHWAKAGNINHAFIERKIQGDFVLIIDADMVVAPQILQRMLPAFYDQSTTSSSQAATTVTSPTSTASVLPSTTTSATTTTTTRWIANRVGWV